MAMVGTLSGYDKDTNRLFTIYVGSAPDKRQEQFYKNVNNEWEKLTSKFQKYKN
jgi:hypothetical protein